SSRTREQLIRHERQITVNKAKQVQSRTSRLAALSSLALSVALLAVAAPSASAYETHFPLPFSPITGAGTGTTIKVAGGVAVDEASGNVFLGEPLGEGVSAVDIFGAEGGVPEGIVPPYQLTGLNAFNGVGFSHLAVDNSAASPSKGTLYVTEGPPTRRVRKFVRD